MTTAAIALFGRDPGGTNQVIALHETLRERTGKLLDSGFTVVDHYLQNLLPPDDIDLLVLGKDTGIRQWEMAGVQAINVASMDDEALKWFFGQSQLLAVLTGTSDIDDRTDHRLWRISESMGIPSAAFLDHTTNLYSRFIGDDGVPQFPDRIFTLDQESCDYLVFKGVPRERLVVGGDLHLQRLKRLQRTASMEKEKFDLRSIWGVRENDRVILFASECVQEMADLGRKSPYSEYLALDELICRLHSGKKISEFHSCDLKNVLIVIRPHPRDRDGKYSAYKSSDHLRIVISSNGGAISAILASDLVVGMNSTLLKEALALNVPTLSLLSGDSIV